MQDSKGVDGQCKVKGLENVDLPAVRSTGRGSTPAAAGTNPHPKAWLNMPKDPRGSEKSSSILRLLRMCATATDCKSIGTFP